MTGRLWPTIAQTNCQAPACSMDWSDLIHACSSVPLHTVSLLQNVDQMKEVPPVAGKRGQGDLKGDMVEGINRWATNTDSVGEGRQFEQLPCGACKTR